MDTKDFESGFPGGLEATVYGCPEFVPDPLPPALEFDKETRDLGEESLLSLGELRAIIPSLPNPALITQPFLRREAVLSSKIEGTKTEIEGLYLFETAQPKRPPRKTESLQYDYEDAREVSNYVTALRDAIDSLSSLPVCNRLLKAAHKTLLDGVMHDRGLYKNPGRFRQVLAYLGSDDLATARFVAPPETHVERLMTDLEKYINVNGSAYPTLVDIALIHYQFEAIHPFSDGNGRVGRLLISLLLISTKLLPGPLLYLSAYFNRNKDEYISRLWDVSRCGAWNEWIAFFLKGVVEESHDASDRARSLLAMREEYRTKIQSDGSASSTLALLDQLFSWPVMDVKKARAVLGMTQQGAQNNLNKLENYGFLEEVTGQTRNRMYVARPIMRLMN